MKILRCRLHSYTLTKYEVSNSQLVATLGVSEEWTMKIWKSKYHAIFIIAQTKYVGEVPAVRLVSVSYLWLRWKNFSPENFAATRANFKSSRNLWVCYLCEKTLTKRCYQLRALSSCTTLSCLFVSSSSLLRRTFRAELPLLRCRHHLLIIREKCACGFEIRTTVRTPAY